MEHHIAIKNELTNNFQIIWQRQGQLHGCWNWAVTSHLKGTTLGLMVHSHYLVSLHWVLCSDNGSCLLNVCWVPKSCHKSKQSSFRAHSALSAINFSSPHRLTLANASIWILLWKCLYIFFKSWKKILSQELGREYYNFLIRSNLTTSVEISFTQVHQLASRRERERERGVRT